VLGHRTCVFRIVVVQPDTEAEEDDDDDDDVDDALLDRLTQVGRGGQGTIGRGASTPQLLWLAAHIPLGHSAGAVGGQPAN
jgi:hypothetical protein